MPTPAPIVPPRLREGDVVAVLSPSWGGPSVYPHVFDLGLRNLESLLGVTVREYPTTRMPDAELYRNPRDRAADLAAAFADPDVKAIVASIGGDDSVRLLPHLDLPALDAHPKILMGYSDTTTLTATLAQHGLVTFSGPSVMAGFAQVRHLPASFGEHVRATLTRAETPPPYAPYPVWSEAFGRWADPAYDGEVLDLRPNDEGWRWLQGEGRVAGRLFGGCIEVLEFLKATPYWPEPDFWEGRILFFETSEDKPTVDQVKYMLRNYGSMGALERIAGLLFGRARAYSGEEKAALDATIVRVASEEFGRPDLPIVTNLDFGHTDPQWVVPLNGLAEIDVEGKAFRLLEPPVA